MLDHACEECAKHFQVVKNCLDTQNIAYEINHRLVRGLDYYTRTAFEVVSNNIGAQGSIAGGGRYDGLVESIGGPSVAGIGFACGMERLALLLEAPQGKDLIFISPPLMIRAGNMLLKLRRNFGGQNFAE